MDAERIRRQVERPWDIRYTGGQDFYYPGATGVHYPHGKPAGGGKYRRQYRRVTPDPSDWRHGRLYMLLRNRTTRSGLPAIPRGVATFQDRNAARLERLAKHLAPALVEEHLGEEESVVGWLLILSKDGNFDLPPRSVPEMIPEGS
jgi:hypothetical protein